VALKLNNMGFFSSLGKMVMDGVETPIAIVKDVATMGGVLTDQKEPYTVKKLKDMGEDWDEMKNSLDK